MVTNVGITISKGIAPSITPLRKKRYTRCAKMPNNDSVNSVVAHFFRIGRPRVPKSPAKTASAKAAVAQAGLVSYNSLSTAGNKAFISSAINACVRYAITPAMFHSSASKLMIQKAVPGFLIIVMINWY
jgi:hypothetical protein